MEYRRLGSTDLEVSAICLGTMTWGEQNSARDAREQLDYAVAQGVNFIDVAEMYPVPPRAATQGRSEAFLGECLARRGDRDRLIVATKISGPRRFDYIRGGGLRLDRKNIRQAVDDSLRRLRTDWIDLYQLHWPDRITNCFGTLGYRDEHDPETVPVRETLEALAEQVELGKVRHVGVSNETPWGVLEALRCHEQHGAPRIASIQNPYSLVNRLFEVGLAEISLREQVSLLGYSPLGMGVLTGKYLDGARPPDARLVRYSDLTRYSHPAIGRMTARYVDLARRHGLDPAQMAIAFTLAQPFLASSIIGATTMQQLRDDLAAADLKLDREVVDGIEQLHHEHANPAW